MAVGDAHYCVSWLSHTRTLTNTTFFLKPSTTFPTCFSLGDRQAYATKKVRLNWVSNSQPRGHKSDTPLSHPGRAPQGDEGKILTTRDIVIDLYS